MEIAKKNFPCTREITGASCRIGLYGVFGNGQVILQCLFIETGCGEPRVPRLRTFLIRGPIISQTRIREVAKRTYLSHATEADDDRLVALQNRNEVIGFLLNESSDLVNVLSRSFSPVVINVDHEGVEIVSAKPLDDAYGMTSLFGTYSVAKLVTVGSYGGDLTADDDKVAGDRYRETDMKGTKTPDVNSALSYRRLSKAMKTLEVYRTNSNKKLSRGYCVKEITFSIRVGGQRYVFDGDDISKWPIDRLFEVTDVMMHGSKYRLVTPIGFIAIAVTDDQCLLMLRTAMVKLYNAVYMTFSGIKPTFDYLGPDLLPGGGPRSVFFTGFPCVLVYSVNDIQALLDETADDAISDCLSMCGLPDIVGPCGKFKIESPGGSCGVPREETDIFASLMKIFRLNGNGFVEREMTEPAGGSVQVHVDKGTLYRVVIPRLREEVLRKCISPRDYPFRPGGSRLSSWRVCTRFIDRLRYRSRDLYTCIRGLECFISQHITSACSSTGYMWVLVCHDAEFFVRGSDTGLSTPDICVSTVLACYWKKLFGMDSVEPDCYLAETGSSVILINDDCMISGFDSYFAERPKFHNWISATGDTLTEIFRMAFADPDWLGSENLKNAMRSMLFRFVGKRHHATFWVETFEPAQHPLDAHPGIVDCAPFNGVWSGDGCVLVQPRDSAVHDDIGYKVYLLRAFSYIEMCLSVAMHRARCEDLNESSKMSHDLISPAQMQLLDEYIMLFNIN